MRREVESDWFDTEESTRLGMVVEVQRIRRRTRARPLPVILTSIVLTALVTYKIATLPQRVEGEVVLALSEGSMANDTALPVEELREYVQNVLLPDNKLAKLIEQRNLFPARKLQGMQFAITEFRENFEIDIWKNQFANGVDEADRSARIGITVTDSSPDKAYELARDLGDIVIETAHDQRLAVTTALAKNVEGMRDHAANRIEEIDREISEKQLALHDAQDNNRAERTQQLKLDIANLAAERTSAQRTIHDVANSKDALADRITAAGLDLNISIVDEHRGQLPPNREFIVIMIAVVVALAALVGTSMLFGAFDSRVHDTDDIERLGLHVLGHLPGFPGDTVGSLEDRGAKRGAAFARVPSFSKWRSHR
ncbi:MAG: hypothetical protein QM831_24460 [Kofleriaceae bacterium]